MEVQQTAPAESSPALEIPRSGSQEYAEWRATGKIAEKKIETQLKEEPAPSDAPKEANSDDAAPSEARQKQERKDWKDERRWKALTDELKSVKSELEQQRRPQETKAESSPARPAQPQTYQDYRKAFKPSEWIADYAKKNPEAGYEDATAAMADHLADVRDQFKAAEQSRQATVDALNKEIADAKSRYGDGFESAKTNFVSATLGKDGSPLIPVEVLRMVNDSPVLADLVAVIGSDEAELAKFVAAARQNPNQAFRYIAKVETLIEADRIKARNDKGQFQTKETPAPAKRGPESAAEPPIEIGQRGTPLDESAHALSALERGGQIDFRAWKRAEDRKDLARRRGI
jgi:hypothetical protein